MGNFELLLKSLPLEPWARGAAFERICKWYLESEPMYARQLRKVYLWKDWPGRWGADNGIDLVAETVDDELWAIQAKAIDPSRAVTKEGIDSFLSESNRSMFNFRLLIATTNTVGLNARQVLAAQQKPADLRLLVDLTEAELEWPSNVENLQPKVPARKVPLPHSVEAVDALVRGFDANSRGQLILPCGTGKTLIAMWAAEALGTQLVLVAVPSLGLMAQTIREWTRNAATPFRFVAVCSDETVADRDAAISDVAGLGLPVTTDPEKIRAFLSRSGRLVVFSTYQSTPSVAEAMDGQRSFDLLIADEAHRCVASTGTFGTVLDDALIRSRRRLFMTATPRYLSKFAAKAAQSEGVRIFSMDDKATFGPVLHRMSFEEALRRRLLSDYRIVVIGVDEESEGMDAIHQRQLVSVPGQPVADAATVAAQVGLVKAVSRTGARRVLTFHNRVERARVFSRTLPSVAEWMAAQGPGERKIWSEYVSGAMSAGHRQTLLNQLRDGAADVSVLSNARCLVEGVDVPDIDAVAFIDPRQSQIDIIQAVGRALRSAPGKKYGAVVVPVFLTGDDAEGPFRAVFQVLRAIRAHDGVLGEELDRLRRQLGRQPGAPLELPDRLVLDLPTALTLDFVEAVKIRIVEEASFDWEYKFGLLQHYVEREGTARVAPDAVERGYRLGEWVKRQRTEHNRGRLAPERSEAFAALPGWIWDLQRDLWEQAYKQLLVFVEREGSSRVEAEAVEGGMPIGQWVQSQRSQFSRGRLRPEDIERLASLPLWSWNLVETRWEEYLRRVRPYLNNRAQLTVDENFAEVDGFRPARWWEHQTRRYRQGLLNEPKRALLEGLPGWSLSWPDEPGRVAHRGKARDQWLTAFSSLETFAAEDGHVRVPKEQQPLYSWLSSQRQLRRSNSLPDDLAEMLQALPGWTWDPWKQEWEEAYAALQTFVVRVGHAAPRLQETEGSSRIGRWVAEQRRRYKAQELEPEQALRLETLPGWRWGR